MYRYPPIQPADAVKDCSRPSSHDRSAADLPRNTRPTEAAPFEQSRSASTSPVLLEVEHRERVIVSCLQCRKRKTHCDRERPTCTECLERGWDCDWSDSTTAPYAYEGRTRTVSTCIECRRRKISCDRLRPCCTMCLEKNLQCEYPIPTRRDSDVLTVAISPNDPSPSKRITSASTNESSEYIDQKFSRYTLARYINSEQSNQPFETRASIPANSPRNVHFGRERIPTSNSLNAISPYGRNANASNSASRDLDDSDIYTRKHFYLRDGHNTVGGSPAQPSRYDEGPRQRCRSEGYPSSSLNSPRVLFANDDNRKTAAQYGRAPQSSDEIPRIPSQSVQYSRRGNKDKPTYLDTDSSSYFGDDYRHSHTRFSEYRSQSPKKTSRATTLSAFDSLPNSDVICGKSVDDDDQRDFNLPALQLQRQSKNHQRLDGVTGEKKFFSCASEDQPHYHDQRSNSHNTGADPANNQYSSLPLSASTSPDVEPIRHPWYPNLSPHSASRLPHMPVSELFEHGTYSRPPVSDPFELSDYQSREFQSLLNTEALRHAPHPRTSGQESQELLEIQRIHSEVVKMHSQMQDMLAMRARLVSAGRADQEFTRNEILMAIRYLVSLRDGDYSESFGEDFDNTRNDTSTSDRLQPMETNHISLSNAILLEKPANGSLTENFSGLRSAPRESQGSISSTHTVQQSLSSDNDCTRSGDCRCNQHGN